MKTNLFFFATYESWDDLPGRILLHGWLISMGNYGVNIPYIEHRSLDSFLFSLG